VLNRLAALCSWRHNGQAVPTRIDAGLWDQWPGLAIRSGDSFNMQFTRRWEL
jgi:hypothetical protein